MNDTLKMAVIFIAGVALGTMFFGGLWFTVRKAVASTKPALLLLGSFIVRITLVLTGFYWIGTGNWQRLLMVFAGFITARFLVIHFTKLKSSTVKKEVSLET